MSFRLRAEQITLWLVVGIFLAFPIALGLANTLMLLVVVGWLLTANYQALGLRVVASPVSISLLALYALIVLGCFWGNAPIEDRYLHLAKYSKLLFAALLIGALHDEVWQRRALMAFCVSMLLIMVCTWLNVWFKIPGSVTQTPGWGLSHHVIGDHITQNIMMAFFVVVLLRSFWLKFREPAHPKRQRQLLMLAILIGLASISVTHLSYGRTGYVLLALAFVLSAAVLLKGKQMAVSGAAIILAGVLIVASSQALRERAAKAHDEIRVAKTQQISSLGLRTLTYRTAPQVFADSPWIGHGTGSYHTIICRYVQPQSLCKNINWHPENQYIAFALGQGGIGLFLYLTMLASALFLAHRTRAPEYRLLLGAITVFLMAGGMANTSLFSSRESHFYLLMIALSTAMAHSAIARQVIAPLSARPIERPVDTNHEPI